MGAADLIDHLHHRPVAVGTLLAVGEARAESVTRLGNLVDQLAGVLLDIAHELGRILLAFGNGGEPLLPHTGQFRGTELQRSQADHFPSLRSRDELLADTVHIVVLDQLLDHVGASGRGSQPATKVLLQLGVVDEAPGMLHRGKQGGVGITLRGRGRIASAPDLGHLDGVPLLQRGNADFKVIQPGKGVLATGAFRDFLPALPGRSRETGLEELVSHLDPHRRCVVFIVRGKDLEETDGDQLP